MDKKLRPIANAKPDSMPGIRLTGSVLAQNAQPDMIE
jgi:hypothetical protein